MYVYCPLSNHITNDREIVVVVSKKMLHFNVNNKYTYLMYQM